jgi:hypothetical protein
MIPNDLERIALGGERKEMLDLAKDRPGRVCVTVGPQHEAPGRLLACGEQLPPVGAARRRLG